MERSTDFTYEDWLAGEPLPKSVNPLPPVEDPALEVHALASEFVDDQEEIRAIDLEVLNKIEHHQKTCFRKAAEIKGAFRLHLFKRDAKYALDYSEAIHAELEVLANNPVLNNYWKDVRKGVVLVNGLSGPVCKRIDEAYHRFQKEGIEGLTEGDPTEREYSQNPDQWADDTLLNWLHTNGSELLQAMAVYYYRTYLEQELDKLNKRKRAANKKENEDKGSNSDKLYRAQEWMDPMIKTIAQLEFPEHDDVDEIFSRYYENFQTGFDYSELSKGGFARLGVHNQNNIARGAIFIFKKMHPGSEVKDLTTITKRYRREPWKTPRK